MTESESDRRSPPATPRGGAAHGGTTDGGTARGGAGAAGPERTWTAAESEAGFEELGDRVIDATRRWLRSAKRQRTERDLYTVEGVRLSLSQIDALEALATGSLRMHELADWLQIDPSTVTRTTAPLVDLGLLEREPDPDNRRYVRLRCTAWGRETTERITKARRRLMREVLEPMEPQRRLLLAGLLEEYLRLTEEHQDHRS